MRGVDARLNSRAFPFVYTALPGISDRLRLFFQYGSAGRDLPIRAPFADNFLKTCKTTTAAESR
ncbi:hypothetical protein BTO02_13675 [Paraburkholderia sp. SOS3]|nr:hypothetical protein BTO02_13675 [Paraburkholderia sp. SOS3]